MDSRRVKDLMVSLEDYAVIDEDDTLLDAVIALEEAQAKLPPGRMKHRAVLIKDKNGKIVGKLGHLAFLKALEPKYSSLGDLKTLARAGLSAEFVNSMMETYKFWDYKFEDICRRAKSIIVKEVCHPISENIDEDAPLSEAIHKFVMWQSLSIPVTRGNDIVGLIRLSDLYSEMSKVIKQTCDTNSKKAEETK
ncbi:MAG: CBS domain-containing protein [Aliifodinibius sp.]|jgi:predicted transcriptional regulator|nr:CBS domain-containing protein [candidate division Zixibacteria bacterium]NIT59236.1 CBS domain-containing protein [Fodinibius sp.]NIW40497.1 CBS domain-containing protein [candidate division Zixibacteria bacterium]NIX57820.1 CBS domain-containing protein [candidate division Zixibacteria bacterium]NIY27819.1 CBS domain-containing protein [Fodinibius sp.]